MTIEAVAGVPGARPPARRRKQRARLADQPRVPIEVELTGFAAGGRAVGRAPDGRVVFVERALPGELVLAEITRDEPSYIEATTVDVRRAAPGRVDAPCAYFGQCGGCQLQHADYALQLELKTAVVAEQLRRIGRFEAAPLAPMLGMADPWGYRNHARFTVRRDGDVGFMEHGTHRFLRIDECLIAHPLVNETLRAVQGRTMQTAQLSVRVGEHTGDVMVQPRLRWRPGRGRHVASGQATYEEELGGVRFRVSGSAFFQVNTRQAERLAAHVVERVLAARPHVVVDAYGGVGTFAALLAPHVAHVLTIEQSVAAGDDAAVNLAAHENVERRVGSVEALLPGLEPAPDVVIVDPPRVGLQPVVVSAILESPARRLVYVSCDPATLARDLRLLVDGGFALVDVQPVDMFPHTQHIECVATLDRTPAS
jgi:23S rRNA (uracil1939-C5)-methyltransferase